MEFSLLFPPFSSLIYSSPLQFITAIIFFFIIIIAIEWLLLIILKPNCLIKVWEQTEASTC